MNTSRREFLKGAAWMGAAAVAAGCHLNRFGFGEGGLMQNYAYRKLMGRKIRVGFVGIGGRGTAAVHRVAMIPGLEVVALCDKNPERIKVNLDWFREQRYAGIDRIKAYVGEEAYKELCDFGDCDVIYCATPWALHQPVALRALNGGKVTLVEVTSALTTDECWELVEASEKWRIPCMQLENCVYGEIELLELNLARMGMFGEINHAEGAYIHDLREIIPSSGKYNSEAAWRYQENMSHKGDRYPTHGLVPICQTLGVNRGDRFDYLVSLESKQANFEWYKQNVLPKDDPRRKDHLVEMGDMNTTLIRTVNGRSILLQHDVSSPRPYSRICKVTGTKGIFWGMPWREKDREIFKMGFEEKVGAGVHEFFSPEVAEEYRQKYRHPLWKQVGEIAKKVGGHGGMDFIMDLRWAYCLQNGLPLDMDVYDLAASSCLCELTERSVRSRSKAVDIPDFTRGGWCTTPPLGVVECDLSKLDFSKAGKDSAALNV